MTTFLVREEGDELPVEIDACSVHDAAEAYAEEHIGDSLLLVDGDDARVEVSEDGGKTWRRFHVTASVSFSFHEEEA